MECLVSQETRQNLFDRIDDEDEELTTIGLTVSLANQVIDWWAQNDDLLIQIIEKFARSIEKESDSVGVDNMSKFLQSWSHDTWSDFLRETFDTVWNFGAETEFEYFFNYAVRQSLGYNTSWGSTQNEPDEFHADWSPAISPDEWELLKLVFRAWWMKDEVFELFSWVYEVTDQGRALFGRGR